MHELDFTVRKTQQPAPMVSLQFPAAHMVRSPCPRWRTLRMLPVAKTKALFRPSPRFPAHVLFNFSGRRWLVGGRFRGAFFEVRNARSVRGLRAMSAGPATANACADER